MRREIYALAVGPPFAVPPTVNVQNSRRLWLILAATTLVVSGAFRWQDRFGKDLRVTFYDVGQGDSALVQFPGGERWLVDAGGAFQEKQVGRRDLFGELTSSGVLTLDAALLSHPDLDHGEGFLALLADLKVRTFLFAAVSGPVKPLLSKLKARAQVRNTQLRPVAKPQNFSFPGGLGELVPVPGLTANDQALVLHLTYGACTTLFTGDLERSGERWLSAYAREQAWPNTTVLKVAHHGSRTSSTPALLRALRPQLAVASTGLTNRYGHPHPFPMERLRQAGADVLHTDFHGFVTVTFKGGNWLCESALGPCGEGSCGEATEVPR